VHSKHNTIKNINKLRILAVDDNTANLLVIQNYLAVQDIPVILASSGIEALTIIETQPVDLIFMDIEMSGMDGIQTTHSIRANETMRTPIVAISAHDESYKRLEVLAHGFDDYLAKPINPDTLTAAVQRWCQIKTTNIAAAAPKAILTAAPKTTPTPKTEPKTSPNTPSKTNHAAHIQHVTKIQTPSTTPTIKKVVDIQQSLVHSNHNNALAKDILDLLIQMVKDEKENIASYHTRNDWDSLYKLNHKIYGGSSYCGVPELQSANQQLEKLLQAKLHFGQESTKESHAEEDLIGIENTHTQTQKIDDAMAQLFSAIDDLIQWDNEYDTSIVFDVENL
jgi:two-component system sensor histidine kinase BarA